MTVMKTIIAASLVLFIPAPAFAADISGLWIVAGDVDHKAFTLFCTFKQEGEKLSGVCHDNTATGKAHVLTKGAVAGEAVAFTYQSNFLITKFDATFEGKLTAAGMAGKANAAGRVGTFTAKRG